MVARYNNTSTVPYQERLLSRQGAGVVLQIVNFVAKMQERVLERLSFYKGHGFEH